MYQYLRDGFYLWQGALDRLDSAGFEVVDISDVSAAVLARMDAIAGAKGAKPQCNPKPKISTKGRVTRPATFLCGVVCRQKKNCGLNKKEEATIARYTKGMGDRELRKAIAVAKRQKRQGKIGGAYTATIPGRGKQGQERQEKRRRRSEKRAESQKKKTPTRKPVMPSSPTRIYDAATITAQPLGTVSRHQDGSVLVQGVQTKPHGFRAGDVSIGRLVAESGKPRWEHFESPTYFQMDGFKARAKFSGTNRSLTTDWAFKVPPQFTEDGFGLAIVDKAGSSVQIFFDGDRVPPA